MLDGPVRLCLALQEVTRLLQSGGATLYSAFCIHFAFCECIAFAPVMNESCCCSTSASAFGIIFTVF